MSRFEENEDNRKNIQEVFRYYSQTLIMDMDVKQIADAADMIVAGYVFLASIFSRIWQKEFQNSATGKWRKWQSVILA